MSSRIVGTLFLLVLGASVAVGEEFGASIRKVDGGKVTFAKFDRETKKPGEEMTLPVADKVKVVRARFNKDEKKFEAGDALEGGLTNERFKNLGEKGVFAFIITDADNKQITEIRVFDFKGKGKGKGFGKGKKPKDA